MNLQEISMKPSDLANEAELLSNAVIGIEFELIVRNYSDNANNYTGNKAMSDIKTWEDLFTQVMNFFKSSNPESTIIDELDTANQYYIRWRQEQWKEYIESWVPDLSIRPENEQQQIIDRFTNTKYAEFLTSYKPSVARWLSLSDLDHMIGWEKEFDLKWPAKNNTLAKRFSLRTLNDIAKSFGETVGTKTITGTIHGETERHSSTYTIEPDESLKSNKFSDGGLEFISPPMSFDEMVDDIFKVVKWAKEDSNAYTNSTCGLHINVSFPKFNTYYLDYVKLILFLGDNYVAKEFKRLDSAYAVSSLNALKNRANNFDPGRVSLIIDNVRHSLYLDASALIQRSNFGDKFVSVNIHQNRVEFRSPGGNWLDMNVNKIINTIRRFIVVLDIAFDKTKYQKEYATKLYKLMAPESGNDDTIALFSLYQSGRISKLQLKNRWAQIAARTSNKDSKSNKLAKTILNVKYYNLIDTDNHNVIATFRAANIDDASDMAQHYMSDHNLTSEWHVELIR